MSEKPGDPDHVWSHIEGQRVALLTTINGEKIVTRPMAPHPDKEAGVIHFISKVESGKTDDMEKESQVNIGFSDPSKNSYLSVSGTARISQDRAKLKELWSTWSQAWLPQGPDAPDVGLITVDLDDATLWDSSSSKVVQVFEHLRAALTGGQPHVGTVEHVSL